MEPTGGAAPSRAAPRAGDYLADALSALEFAQRAYRSGRARDAIEGIDDARRTLATARRKVNIEREESCRNRWR